MLTPEQLRAAAQLTEKASEGVCSRRYCRLALDLLGDGNGYRVAHNGIGSRDSDCQVVYAKPVLDATAEKLAEKLIAWVRDLHAGSRLDLNAT